MTDFAWKQFSELTEDHSVFISSSDGECCQQFQAAYKELYDFLKKLERPQAAKKAKTALPCLLVEGYPDEQIWQQVELLNSQNLQSRLREVETAAVSLNFSKRDDSDEIEVDLEDRSSEEENQENDVYTEEETDAELSGSDQDAKKNTVGASTAETFRPSIVDDQFFIFEEMEQFADAQEEVNGTRKEELDDYALFEEDDSNMEEQGVYYHDFFDPPAGKKSKATDKRHVTFADEIEHSELVDDPENETVNNSSFKVHQERLKDRVIRLEEENLAPKPWELVGEVSALVRPENSLLDKSLLFDRATRLPPVITPESTERLEAIIKRRVKDRPTNDLGVYKSELVLDQQKSKLSLSQIYEQEYLKKTEKLEVERQCPAHEEIRQLLKDLFFKLDALTNFHYTPRPPVPEFAVVSNMPSIVMEEVAPVTVSDATMLAPEEIKRRDRHEPSAPEENTETDRKRLRRKIKRIQSLRSKKRQSKAGESDKALVPKDKMQLLRKVGTVKKTMPFAGKKTISSSEFFDKLAAQAKQLVRNEAEREEKEKKKKKGGSAISSSAFKL
ncbi:hypothetical protein M514_03639 [Trichuris suis]|uniref:U3 small nucleolar ribonucleoprotein protein MPP10 n=1 Tax=Trichuris suis TaxID=68888 RepID=A0A085N052_9BILA|nr:hypothetical protein M513_03639 [Trichuris suis]KFD62848.1 hypothetical protein M514_03639 [Trichuris suis]